MTVLRKEFLDIQVTIECTFPLKRVFDMIIAYNKVRVRKKISDTEGRVLIFDVEGGNFVFISMYNPNKLKLLKNYFCI